MSFINIFNNVSSEQGALLLSGLAILVSGIIAVKSLNIERGKNKFELEKGKISLYNLTSRYFLINLQRTDFIGTSFKLKKDSAFDSNYRDELKNIATQIDTLMSSSYYTVLYKKYPMIGVMSVFIRKEIMFIDINNANNSQYGFDDEVWNKMFTTYELLREEIELNNNEWNDIIENEIYKNAKQINDFLLKKNLQR